MAVRLSVLRVAALYYQEEPWYSFLLEANFRKLVSFILTQSFMSMSIKAISNKSSKRLGNKERINSSCVCFLLMR
jgi:hypothetical protein